jgi:hypothetical protein
LRARILALKDIIVEKIVEGDEELSSLDHEETTLLFVK